MGDAKQLRRNFLWNTFGQIVYMVCHFLFGILIPVSYTHLHSAAGRPYPAGGAGRTETATAAHKGTVIDGRKHFTPQHGGTAL